MTPREQALARIKTLGEQMQAAGGALPADKMAAMFADLTAQVQVLAVNPAPLAGANVRKMRFPGIGDKVYRTAEVLGQLPKDVQKEYDGAMIAAALLRRPVSQTKTWKRLIEGSEEFKKALDSTTSGEGDEWVPTILSPELIAEVTLLAGVEQVFRHMVMPSNPYDVPLQTGRLTARKTSEQTADSGQTAVTKSSGAGITNKLTLTAQGIQAEVLTSKNLEEDSIVPIMPFLREEIVRSIVRGIEEAVINGDTTGSHQDSDVTDADDRRKLWKGLRKHSIEQSRTVDFAGAGNAFNLETILKVRAKLGKYGINPGDLVYIVSLATFFKLLSLKDASGSAVVVTADKFGANATAITGVLGNLLGSPILVSEFVREDLDSTGVFVSGQTKTILHVAQRSGFVFGDRRDTTLQVLGELYAEYDQDALLVTHRKDFQPVRPIASNAAVAAGINIATT